MPSNTDIQMALQKALIIKSKFLSAYLMACRTLKNLETIYYIVIDNY